MYLVDNTIQYQQPGNISGDSGFELVPHGGDITAIFDMSIIEIACR